MSSSDNRCRICGGLNSPEASASITQWIQKCSCKTIGAELLESEGEAFRLCNDCGKRITKSRPGSFTQWIFRADICKCESGTLPATMRTGYRSNASEPIVANTRLASELDIEAIEVDSEKFPASRYIPRSLVGGGAAGTVFRCMDKLLQKDVAIKTLNSLEADQVISFQQEAKATSSISHEHIVQVLDFGITDGGTPFMVMEYVPGSSLEQLIDEGGALNPDVVVEISIQVCKALSHAHKKGIFHRDVKTSNILLSDSTDDEIDVKVIDFGVAGFKNPNQMLTLSQGVTLVGSPAYMSPDQAQSRKYDERSEVYSVGCTMFTALTGKNPFRADNALELIRMHAHEAPPSISASAPDVSEELENIVYKCLAKKPEDRYQSIDELLTALQLLGEEAPLLDDPQELFPVEPTPEIEAEKTSAALSSSMIALLVVAVVGTIGLITWMCMSIMHTENFARVSDRHDATLVQMDDVSAPKFHVSLVGDRHWLTATGSVTDDSLAVLKGRTDFQVISFDKQPLTGTGLKYLADSNLQGINLPRCAITKEGMVELAKLKSLVEVNLEGCPIDNQEIWELTKLPNLHWLSLHGTNIDDEGLSTVAQISKLSLLSLHGCHINGKGLASIASLPVLSHLDISGTDISPSEFILLKRFPSLQVLTLGKSFTDSDLDQITDLPLKILDLSQSRVTERCIPKLGKMRTLQQVVLPRISDYNLKRLQKLLPQCRILAD